MASGVGVDGGLDDGVGSVSLVLPSPIDNAGVTEAASARLPPTNACHVDRLMQERAIDELLDVTVKHPHPRLIEPRHVAIAVWSGRTERAAYGALLGL